MTEMNQKKQKYKALIVDDDKDLLEVLSDIFINADFKVVTATDGVDASFKFNNEVFDIILTDIKMPKKDGIKFAQFIQSSEATKIAKSNGAIKPTPIIFISASVEDYRVELEVLGNVEVLSKPFTPKVVLDKVHSLLEKKNAQAPASNGNYLSFKAGDYIIKEGEVSSSIFFLKEGALKVVKTGSNGVSVTVTTIKAGEMVGEMGVLFHRKRTASVIALTDSVLISIPKEKIESHLESQPKWFKVFFDTISTRLEETTHHLVEERSRKS